MVFSGKERRPLKSHLLSHLQHAQPAVDEILKSDSNVSIAAGYPIFMVILLVPSCRHGIGLMILYPLSMV
jgi:hypothetical protein